MNHLLKTLVLGASCCFLVSTCWAVDEETLGSGYQNKAFGIQMRVPPRWDLEDLGSQAPERWDFLVKTPLGQRTSGGIHITRQIGATTGGPLARDDIKKISRNRRIKSSSEKTAMIGKRSAHVTTIIFEAERDINFYKVFVVSVDDASWVIRCVMDNPDDLETAHAFDGILNSLILKDPVIK